MAARSRESGQVALPITVKTLAGDLLELRGQLQTTVGDLKAQIDQHWGVPPICQKLVRNVTVLDDSKQLVFYMDGEELIVTLVKSLDQAYEVARAGSVPQALAALEAIGDVASTGDEKAVETLSTYAKTHRASYLTLAAVRSLARVARKGDPLVIEALIICSECEGGHIIQDLRVAAVKALAQVAEQGDQHVLTALHVRMHDEDRMVRLSALKALAQLVQKADDADVSAARAALTDESFMVREAASAMLERVMLPCSPRGFRQLLEKYKSDRAA